MKIGEITVDHRRVGDVQLVMLEPGDDMLQMRGGGLAEPGIDDFGDDGATGYSPMPGSRSPSSNDAPVPTPKSKPLSGPTFRRGIGPGSRMRREKQLRAVKEGKEGPTFRRGIGPGSKMRRAAGIKDEEENVDRSNGSAFLASKRAPFKKELQDHPETKELFAAIIHAENPGAGPAVAESLMNRTELVNESRRRRGLPPVTLHDMMLYALGEKERGLNSSFYGPMRPNRGLAITGHLNKIRRDTAVHAQMDKYIDAALGGSNTIKSNTDQGSRNDPNYYAGGVGVNINGERFNDWGYPGARQWREQRQREYEQALKNQHDPNYQAPSTTTTPTQRAETRRAEAEHQLGTPLDGKPTTGAPEIVKPIAPGERADPNAIRTVGRAAGGLRSIDPNLREVMAGGISAFEQAHPGYRVEAFSGYRPGDSGYHGRHLAADFQIVGPNGVIESRGPDPTGMYHDLARYAKGYMMQHRPDLASRFNWGGAHSTSKQGPGPPDLMHFDLGGHRGRYVQNRIENLSPLYPSASSASTPSTRVSRADPSPSQPAVSPMTKSQLEQNAAGIRSDADRALGLFGKDYSK